MILNATKSDVTNFSPFEIIYGKKMDLPESVITNLPSFPISEPTT